MSRSITRRELFRFVALGAAGSLLAACAPKVVEKVVEKEVTKVVAGTPQIVEVTAEPAPGEKPLIRFALYNFDPWLQALPRIFGDFENEVGTAQVKIESAPWDQFYARFESQAAAGIAPDLHLGDPGRIARYVDKGLYLNLDEYVARDGIDLKAWLPVTIEGCRYDKDTGLIGRGSLWGMPSTFVGSVLYYNKDLFDQAGVAYPDDNWTRDDFTAAALKLTKDQKGNAAGSGGFDPDNIAVYGCNTIRDEYSPAVQIWNNGGGLVSEDQKECWFTKPETVEIFQWLADLVLKQHTHPSPAWFEGQPDTFLTQKIAMVVVGTWNVDYYVDKLTFNWDLAPVPKGTKGLPRVTYASTNPLDMYSGSKLKEQSWELLKFMVGPGGMKYLLKTGTPALISAAESADYLTGKPEHRKVAVDIGSYARGYYPHRDNEKWKEIYEQEIVAIYMGKATAQDVCQKICGLITPILQGQS